jgi:hypothetical protein
MEKCGQAQPVRATFSAVPDGRDHVHDRGSDLPVSESALWLRNQSNQDIYGGEFKPPMLLRFRNEETLHQAGLTNAGLRYPRPRKLYDQSKLMPANTCGTI